MPFLIIDAEGHKRSFQSDAEFLDAVRGGVVTERTLLFDDATSRWAPAHESPMFRMALVVATEIARAHDRSSKPTATAPPTPFQRRHRWQGTLFIWLSYIGAAAFGLGGLSLAIAPKGGEGTEATLPILVLRMTLAVLTAAVATGVGRFRPWARHAALVIAYIAGLGSLALLLKGIQSADGAQAFAALLSGALQLVFIVYFHRSRPLFEREMPPSEQHVA